jgi:beta-glucanase (GH16 family)
MIFQKNTIRATLLYIVSLFIYSDVNAQKTFTKLVWADEFNKPGMPDTLKWSYDTGRGCPQNCGWGNNELQYYTVGRKENARIEKGKLIIEAKKESFEDAKYTSARLVSKKKGDWKYGRIEVRAKLPAGTGMWPAIWMLPTNWEYGGWPRSGEIDIMENVGYWPDSSLSTIHTGAYNGMIGTQKTNGKKITDLSTAFHVYSIEWTADMITFLIDHKKFYEF